MHLGEWYCKINTINTSAGVKSLNMVIRKAVRKDTEQIMAIYNLARQFMADSGNTTQWENGYPTADIVENDIINGNSYVCVENQSVVGVFSFIIGEEPT